VANSITGRLSHCNHRIAVTLCTLETLFPVYVVIITLCGGGGDGDDDDNDDDTTTTTTTNNNNNNGTGAVSGCSHHIR
jgi:hypothetical protein